MCWRFQDLYAAVIKVNQAAVHTAVTDSTLLCQLSTGGADLSYKEQWPGDSSLNLPKGIYYWFSTLGIEPRAFVLRCPSSEPHPSSRMLTVERKLEGLIHESGTGNQFQLSHNGIFLFLETQSLM